MKRKKRYEIPLSINLYFLMALVVITSLLISFFSTRVIISKYIENECKKRIENAVTSCSSFASTFPISIKENEFTSEEEIRDFLLNSIVSSTDISNDASIVLFSTSPDAQENSPYSILWPQKYYSNSVYNLRKNVLYTLVDQNLAYKTKNTEKISVDNSDVYYKIVSLEYNTSNKDDLSDPNVEYFLLFYIDSNYYNDFMSSLNITFIRTMCFSVIASFIISLLISIPLINSTKKLSKFATNIGRGKFYSMNDNLHVTELNSLSSVMNRMAYQLQESDKEKNTFFQNASHELRTPLMSIQGYAEGIKYDVFEKEKKEEAIDIIISESDRLTSLVNNLLTISKLDMSANGNYEVKKQVLEVLLLTDSVVSKVRGGFLHKDISLINNIRIKKCYIYASENDIFRMLENIFSNCLRYATKSVYFDVYTEESNVIFKIYDDGPGISEELVDHLFERFIKGEEGKHGIGLSLAKAIATEHNGTITAYNLEGYGACFEIKLPTIETEK